MNRIILVSLVSAIAALSGCDRNGDGAGGSQPAFSGGRSQMERNRLKDALAEFIGGKLRLVRSQKEKTESKLKKVEGDIAKFSKISQSIAGDLGEVLSGLFKSSEINALAVAYISEDFTSVIPAYTAKIGEIREQEKKYNEEVASVELQYSDNLKQAAKWVDVSKQQHEAEVKRMKSDIAAYEKKRDDLFKELKEFTLTGRRESRMSAARNVGGNAEDRRREQDREESRLTRERNERQRILERKLEDAESQLEKKRNQLDQLNAPSELANQESRFAERAQTARSRANNDKDRAMRDIDRRLKPKETVVSFATAYEEKTVGKLRAAMRKASEGLKAELEKLSDQENLLQDMSVRLPMADLQALNAMKAKIDKL